MARSKQEVAQAMKRDFMSNPTLQEAYKMQDEAFDTVFSKVSLEAILISIVSTSIWLLEQLWSLFAKETEEKIDNSYVTSLRWYHSKALEFQKGKKLVYDEKTYSFKYPDTDPDNRVVKHAAVREVIVDSGSHKLSKIRVYFSGEEKKTLPAATQEAFEQYMREIGAAGTHYQFINKNPDALGFRLTIWYNPILIDSNGNYLDTQTKPVEKSIETYLDNLKYGEVFYTSQLLSVIQQVEGVTNVKLEGISWRPDGTETEDPITYSASHERIDSESGAFVLDKEASQLTYNLEER